MRNISFSLTEEAFLNGTKTVTRRLGWESLKPGSRLKAVRRAMGLRRGEHPVVLGEIEVVDVRRERLDAIPPEDVAAEGFSLTVEGFIAGFCQAMGCKPHTEVTRIEFLKLKRFWISWYTVHSSARGTSWSWWVSGEACTEPTLYTICADIFAKSADEAKRFAQEAFSDAGTLPEPFGWRFCDETTKGPPSDRFPS